MHKHDIGSWKNASRQDVIDYTKVVIKEVSWTICFWSFIVFIFLFFVDIVVFLKIQSSS